MIVCGSCAPITQLNWKSDVRGLYACFVQFYQLMYKVNASAYGAFKRTAAFGKTCQRKWAILPHCFFFFTFNHAVEEFFMKYNAAWDSWIGPFFYLELSSAEFSSTYEISFTSPFRSSLLPNTNWIWQ